jgi:transposase InsO family protein
MLNDSELNDYFLCRNLSPAARGQVVRIRESQPSRAVGGGTRNVPCRFASRKMACTIQAESHTNELAAIITWEYDLDTFEFYDQPPKIKLTYEDAKGRRRAHMVTPDFFVLQTGFTGWVECKTEEWLREHAQKGGTRYIADGHGGWRCPAGEEFAAAYGLGFRVRSSAETNWTAVRNAEFLHDYLDDRAPSPTAEQRACLARIFENQSWILLKELLAADPELTADAIFTVIARGQIHVDLENQLLAEPERTIVFRDVLAAKAYRANLISSQIPAVPDLQALRLERGQSLIWDGRLMHIINVGDTEVYLEDETRAITALRQADIGELVGRGAIRGLPADLPSALGGVADALRHASPTDIEVALKRYASIFPDRVEGATVIGSDRIRRKWHRDFRRSAEMTGHGFVGLLPKLHCRGNRTRKLDQKVIEIMNAVIAELYAQPGQRRRYACWGEVRNRCIAAGLIPPSAKAFRHQIGRHGQHEVIKAREGEKAAYDKEEFYWALKRTPPRHGERPFQIAHIDHTTIDLQFVGSRHGEGLGKAWLTVMIDAFTRMIVAWVVHFEEPSYRSCMRVIRECIRRNNRIAQYIVVDGGPEFKSTYFEKLLALLDVSKKTRPKSKPRHGSVVERIFGTADNTFIHNLIGNNQALQKPRRMSRTHDPRRLAVWTLPEFNVAFEGYLDSVYHAKEHPAHGMTPKDAMEAGLALSGLREHRLIPYTAELAVWCLPSTTKETAKVDAVRGVKIGYIWYWTDRFRGPLTVGKRVPVRYDPDNASIAFVWLDNKEWVPCRSEYAATFDGLSEKEIQLATEELRGRLQRDGKRRPITASLIAEHLTSVRVTEKMLLQRERHLESAEADDHDLKAMAGIPGSQSTPGPVNSTWSNLHITAYGEFK